MSAVDELLRATQAPAAPANGTAHNGSTVDKLLAGAATANRAPNLDGGVERDHLGRYLILSEDGLKKKPYTRATTLANTLSDTYRLNLWKTRMALIGMTMRRDLYARVASSNPETDRDELDALAEEAQTAAGADEGRNLGTSLHAFTERLDRGEDISNTPAPWDADLAAYRETMRAKGIEIVPGMIEKIVVCEELEIAGTFDRLVTIRKRIEAEGRAVPRVADLKTKKGDLEYWLEIAIQLAIYAHADFIYDPVTKTREPMPEVDQAEAIVMHLPVEQANCQLYVVDIAYGWELAQMARDVRNRRKVGKSLGVRFDEAVPLATDDNLEQLLTQSVAQIEGEGERAGAVGPGPLALDPAVITMATEGLKARFATAVAAGAKGPVVWPEGVPLFKDGGPATWAHVKLVERLVLEVEAETGQPFHDPLPIDPTVRAATPESRAEQLLGISQAATATRTPPDPEVLDGLAKRVAALPEDLRATATEDAHEHGLPVSRHEWDESHVEVITDAVVICEYLAQERIDKVKVALGDFEPATATAVLAAAGVAETPIGELTADQAHLLIVLACALDAGTVVRSTAPGGVELAAGEGAEKALVAAHGSKAAVLAAAKDAAPRWGRPKPKATKDVASDPVLIAVLTAPGATTNHS